MDEALLKKKMTAGTPEIDKAAPAGRVGRFAPDPWRPCGAANGVIFRAPQMVPLVRNEKIVIGADKRAVMRTKYEGTIKQAMCYLRPLTSEERIAELERGGTCDYGTRRFTGPFMDMLISHNPLLKKEIDAGYQLDNLFTNDEIGMNADRPEVMPWLVLYPVEEGVFVIVYDPPEDAGK